MIQGPNYQTTKNKPRQNIHLSFIKTRRIEEKMDVNYSFTLFLSLFGIKRRVAGFCIYNRI